MMRAIPSLVAILAYAKRARMKSWETPPYDLIVKPGPGQESVWDFPRPPILQDVPHRIRVEIDGMIIADTMNAIRICETAGAPCYYIPPNDIKMEWLTQNGEWSLCEWKGVAMSYDLKLPSKDGKKERVVSDAAWSYVEPLTDLGMGYERIAGYLAFYAGKMDGCYIGEEKVTPQPGGYYGGWVTKNLLGPIKGEPGGGAW